MRPSEIDLIFGQSYPYLLQKIVAVQIFGLHCTPTVVTETQR